MAHGSSLAVSGSELPPRCTGQIDNETGSIACGIDFHVDNRLMRRDDLAGGVEAEPGQVRPGAARARFEQTRQHVICDAALVRHREPTLMLSGAREVP